MKPLGKVKIEWSPEFAYAIGLLVTDGSLSKDGRHMVLVSKDREMIENFKGCLHLENSIGRHSSGNGGQYFRIQFGDVNFYSFLITIGLEPNKSKIMNEIWIPDEYFFDFLRGHHDGDGTFYSYWDPRWRSSFMFYTVFLSASEKHICWIREQIFQRMGIKGHIAKGGSTPMYTVKYAKKDSLQLLSKMYYNRDVVCLSRKRIKIQNALAIIKKNLTN